MLITVKHLCANFQTCRYVCVLRYVLPTGPLQTFVQLSHSIGPTTYVLNTKYLEAFSHPLSSYHYPNSKHRNCLYWAGDLVLCNVSVCKFHNVTGAISSVPVKCEMGQISRNNQVYFPDRGGGVKGMVVWRGRWRES